jgi:spermidine/putrescine transport system permease protein
MDSRKIVGRRRFSKSMTIFGFTFMYLPIFILVVMSFNNARQGVAWNGFTLKWYAELFQNNDIWRAFWSTAWIAFTSAAVATAIGTFTAIGFFWRKGRFKKVGMLTILSPLIFPDILMGISLLIFFIAIKFPLGYPTILIAHITFCISYVAIVVNSRLEDFDYSIIEAARDLGAKNIQVVLKVIIPSILPAIIAAFLLSVTLSVDDFVITFFVTGPGATTLPLQIYSMIKMGVSPVINALSTILLVLTLLVSFLGVKFQKFIF